MDRVVIVGSGPAGISAAIYVLRAGLKATIVSSGLGALEKADKVENYYGFEQPISGKELLAAGIAQARRLGAVIVQGEVVNLAHDGEQFRVTGSANAVEADSVILATGSSRALPRIAGFPKFESSGVSFCAVCDGFFYRGKDVAVLGCCEYAAHEARELLPLASSVTLVTNGIRPIDDLPEGLRVDTRPIAELRGDDALEAIAFADGGVLPVRGLFVAQGVAGSADLAKKVGAETVGNRIAVGEDMQSSVPLLFAAGDCTGGMMQIAKAVYEGARAGTEAVRALRARKKGRA
ncbi:MAG: NAD(P)/FAD-dependent oxidoreductase [Clostridiales bacterium]|nr:NAD(P)/FAD-dependent oxidoreductase [Clostridiales bacterium]